MQTYKELNISILYGIPVHKMTRCKNACCEDILSKISWQPCAADAARNIPAMHFLYTAIFLAWWNPVDCDWFVERVARRPMSMWCINVRMLNSIQLCLEAKTVGDLNLVSVYGEPYLWISSIVSKHTFGGIHTVYRLGLTRTINIFLIPVFCLHFVFAHESLWFTPLVLFLQTSEPKTHSHVQVRLNRFNFLSYFSFNQLGLTSTDRIRKELLLFILGFSNTVLFEINVRVLTCRQVMHGFVFQQVVAIFLFDA